MELYLLVGNLVGSSDGRSTRIVVVVFPRRQCAVGFDSTVNLNQSSGPEIRPGELLFACPNEFDRFAYGFRIWVIRKIKKKATYRRVVTLTLRDFGYLLRT